MMKLPLPLGAREEQLRHEYNAAVANGTLIKAKQIGRVLDAYLDGCHDTAKLATTISDPLWRAVRDLVAHVWNEHDECRWCGFEVDEGHSVDCLLVVVEREYENVLRAQVGAAR